MIELLILYELSQKVLTMYGISKEIRNTFSSLMLPSIGTIKPALNRMESAGFIKTQKTMSSGGRPSTYYSLTTAGKDELKHLILAEPRENPVNFLSASRIKLFCADILDTKEQKELCGILKLKAESIMIDSKNQLESNDGFYPKMVFDNLICDYKNFISFLEGLEHACKD